MLACGGSVKAIHAFKQLKRANATLTFENALNPVNAKEIADQTEKYFLQKAEFKKKCKLSKQDQEKHIKGSKSYEDGDSVLTVSIKELETLTQSLIGRGIPDTATYKAGITFGEVSYKEIVDFGKQIGISYSEKNPQGIATSVGKIHYKKTGKYHVVPSDPIKLPRDWK